MVFFFVVNITYTKKNTSKNNTKVINLSRGTKKGTKGTKGTKEKINLFIYPSMNLTRMFVS